MRRSMLVGAMVSSVIASCAIEETDATEQAINSDQCISIGSNPIGPETLCGPFARRWAQGADVWSGSYSPKALCLRSAGDSLACCSRGGELTSFPGWARTSFPA